MLPSNDHRLDFVVRARDNAHLEIDHDHCGPIAALRSEDVTNVGVRSCFRESRACQPSWRDVFRDRFIIVTMCALAAALPSRRHAFARLRPALRSIDCRVHQSFSTKASLRFRTSLRADVEGRSLAHLCRQPRRKRRCCSWPASDLCSAILGISRESR